MGLLILSSFGDDGTAAISDTLTLADLIAAMAVAKVLTNGFSTSDSAAKLTGKNLTNAFVMADLISASIGGSLSLSNAIVLADLMAAKLSKVLTNSFALSDTQTKQPNKILTNAFALADTMSATIGAGIGLVNGFVLSDSKIFVVNKVSTDSFPLLDQISFSTGLTKSLGDSSMALSDGVSMRLNPIDIVNLELGISHLTN